MITSIRLTNVGPIADLDIQLGAVTLCYGKNGSGKSTFLRAAAGRLPLDAIRHGTHTAHITRVFAGSPPRTVCTAHRRNPDVLTAHAVPTDQRTRWVPMAMSEQESGSGRAAAILQHAQEHRGTLIVDGLDIGLYPAAAIELVNTIKDAIGADTGISQVIASVYNPYTLDAVGLENVLCFNRDGAGNPHIRYGTEMPDAIKWRGWGYGTGELASCVDWVHA